MLRAQPQVAGIYLVQNEDSLRVAPGVHHAPAAVSLLPSTVIFPLPPISVTFTLDLLELLDRVINANPSPRNGRPGSIDNQAGDLSGGHKLHLYILNVRLGSELNIIDMEHAVTLRIDLQLADLPGDQASNDKFALRADRDNPPVIPPAKDYVRARNRGGIYRGDHLAFQLEAGIDNDIKLHAFFFDKIDFPHPMGNKVLPLDTEGVAAFTQGVCDKGSVLAGLEGEG